MTATLTSGTRPGEVEAALLRARLLLRRRLLWMQARRTRGPLDGLSSLVISDEEALELTSADEDRAERAFRVEHPGAAALTEQIECAPAPAPGPLARLAERLELDGTEHELLVLALAVELDPRLARLCAYLNDDAGRPHLTPALFAALESSGEKARAALGAAAPLRRFGLVRLDAHAELPWAARPLRMPERVVAALTGDAPAPPGDLIVPVAAPPLAPESAELAASTATLLAADVEMGSWPALMLIAEPGAPARGVAAAALAHAGLSLWQPAAEALHLLGDADLALALDREAALGDVALLLEPDRVPGPEARAGLVALAARLAAPIAVVAADPPPLDRAIVRVEVPRTSTAGQRELWGLGLGDSDEAVLDALAAQFDLAPEQIADALREALRRARVRGGPDAVPDRHELWSACRTVARRHAGGLAQPLHATAHWEDLVLPGPLMQRLHELAGQVEHRGRVYETWGFGVRLTRGRGITALFAGPSGTGKTLAAEVLATELRLDLCRVDLSAVVSKYIGETEKNLRRVFEGAEGAGALLFFDEADALFGKRTEVRDSHDRYANIEVDYLLSRMEEYRGLAVLATNRKAAIDPAFLRRLRFVLDFPFPDLDSRRRLWEIAFPDEAPCEELDLDRMARLDLSGASIHAVALNAAFAAAAAGGPIAPAHVQHALRAEYAKLNRLPRAAERDLLGGAS